jgi:predicted DCC family thiol-disulfide oxidoreductase YuxK
MKPTLIYDATCPVCTNYKRFIERRLKDRLDYEPATPDQKDVHYRSSTGQLFEGTKAVEKLTSDFPEIRDLNMLLPQCLRDMGVNIPGKIPTAGMKAIYKVSGAVRKS